MKIKFVVEKPKGKLAGLPKLKKSTSLPVFEDVVVPKTAPVLQKSKMGKTSAPAPAQIKSIRPTINPVVRNKKVISTDELYKLIINTHQLNLVAKNLTIVEMGPYKWLQYLHNPDPNANKGKSMIAHLRLGWALRDVLVHFEMKGHINKNGIRYEVYSVMGRARPPAGDYAVKTYASAEKDANLAPSKQGTYIAAKLFDKSLKDLTAWAKKHFAGCVNLYASCEIHATIAYSKEPIYGFSPRTYKWEQAEATVEKVSLFGKDEDMVVLRLRSEYLSNRAKEAAACGGTSDFETYKPHITIGKLLDKAKFEEIAAQFDNSLPQAVSQNTDYPEYKLPKLEDPATLCFAYEKMSCLDSDWGSKIMFESIESASTHHGAATVYDKPKYCFLPVVVRNSQLISNYVAVCPILEITGERLVRNTLCYDGTLHDAQNINVPLLRSLKVNSSGLFSVSKYGSIHVDKTLIPSGLSDSLQASRAHAAEYRAIVMSQLLDGQKPSTLPVLYGEI